MREIAMTNKAIIQGIYQGFATGDIQAVTAAFADDIKWTEAGSPVRGRKRLYAAGRIQ